MADEKEAKMDTVVHYQAAEPEHDFMWYAKQVFTNPFYFLIMIALIIFFIFTKDLVYKFPVFWVVLTAVGTLVFGFKATMMWFKNASPKLVFNQVRTTTVGKPVTVMGKWDFWSMGDIHAYGLSWHGSEGTVIVPHAARNDVGRCVVYPVRVWRYYFENLPHEMQRALAQFGLDKKNVFWGLIDDSQYYTKVDTEGFRLLDDKALATMSRLKMVDAKLLADFILEEVPLKNAYWLVGRESSKALQDLSGDIRRIKDLTKKSAFETARDVMTGRQDKSHND